jgi:hypothetical protein
MTISTLGFVLKNQDFASLRTAIKNLEKPKMINSMWIIYSKTSAIPHKINWPTQHGLSRIYTEKQVRTSKKWPNSFNQLTWEWQTNSQMEALQIQEGKTQWELVPLLVKRNSPDKDLKTFKIKKGMGDQE